MKWFSSQTMFENTLFKMGGIFFKTLMCYWRRLSYILTLLFQIPLCQGMLCCYGKLLTHWGRVTHICVSKLSIIGSDNGLSPDRRQAIIWTNAGILLIGTLGTNLNEFLFEIHTFLFKNIRLKMSSGKWRPFCLGLNVLIVFANWIGKY